MAFATAKTEKKKSAQVLPLDILKYQD